MHRDRHRLLLVTSLIAAAAAVTLVACKSGPRRQPAPTAQPPLSHSAPFHRLPPAVEDATIERLAAPNNDGNALLEVKFEAGDPRTAKGVSIFPEGKEVRLVDNGAGADRAAGDGVFSSFIQFDFAEAARARDAEMKRLSGQREPRNIFRNRHIIGVENTKAALERFRKFPAGADIPVGLKFPLGIFGSVVSPSSIDPARSLVITDESVIEDPNRTFSICPSHRASSGGNPDGVWTFKHLMTEMANTPVTGIDPADFTEQWLSLWLTNQVPPPPPPPLPPPPRRP
ncbi:MAG TPA: hypothetical protein VHN77_04030, partial [Phycisphaerales bacterium]|nr:hypothetical protein [Phycisphaerales bacterium]